jgi:5-methylcytosine-specific restriction endonuclease McrA
MSNYSGKEWQALRREFLADAVCHWCRRAKATELDHIIELDRGGTNDPDNLVPACKKCNSRRGAEYLAKKRAASVQARQKAISTQKRNSEKNQKKSEIFFENEKIYSVKKKLKFL